MPPSPDNGAAGSATHAPAASVPQTTPIVNGAAHEVKRQDAPPDSYITFLECAEGKFARKTLTSAFDLVRDFDAGMVFKCTRVAVTNIASLAELIQTAEAFPDFVVIRGEPTGERLSDGRVLRRSLPKDGHPAYFRETPGGLRWFMLDFDNISLTEPFAAHDPEATIRGIIATLPDYMRDVSCFWQLSSRMGKDPLVGKVHLWYISDRAVTDAELKTWAAPLEPRPDPSLFNPVQLHYIARPDFQGSADPLPRRSGLLPGAVDEVSLPDVATAIERPDRPAPATLAGPRESTDDRVRRAKAWLAKAEAAVSGRRGHDRAFAVVERVVRGFDLCDDGARAALADWNARCVPPWDERELDHKITDGRARGDTRIGELLTDAAPKAEAVSYVILEVERIFAALPDIPYLIKDLDIAPGAPAMIAGYGYSLKTAATQQGVIDLASPQELLSAVWGKFPASRRARVTHVDYEQGQLTLRRYQRLARAKGVSPQDLAGFLRVISMPHLFLNTPGAIDALERICDGQDLTIFDSLRAAVPGAEENSSDFRRPLDALTRISEKTRCAMLVIHHARKPSQDGNRGGAKMSIRGTGAIFDACSSVLVFEGTKGAPTKVSHEKARNSGITTDDFELTIEDVDGDGLRVRACGIVQKTAEDKSNEKAQADVIKLRAYLLKNNFFKNRDQVQAALAISSGRVAAAMGAMLTSGELVQEGSHSNRTYYLAGPGLASGGGPSVLNRSENGAERTG